MSCGVASAMKSSTPASTAIAAAVVRLSPVTMTVRMPIARKAAKRSRIAGLTTSLRWTTPSSLGPSATASGVPPVRAIRSTAAVKLAGTTGLAGPALASSARMLSTAPLRIATPSRSTPESRVWALNGTRTAGRPVRSGRAMP